MRGLTDSEQRASGWLVWLWVLLILFCSTDVASSWADAVFAFLLSHGGPPGGLLRLLVQKCFHVFLFGVLGLLAALPHRLRTPAFAVGICVVIGIVSEVFQAFWPSRSPSALDAALNLLSGLSAYALIFRWLSRRPLQPLASRAAGD